MDDEDIKNEIAAIAKEIEYAVEKVEISPNCNKTLLLTVKEGVTYRLLLRHCGLEVTSVHLGGSSNQLPSVNVGQVFESIYSFLDKVSPSYRHSFARSLSDKLSYLKDE